MYSLVEEKKQRNVDYAKKHEMMEDINVNDVYKIQSIFRFEFTISMFNYVVDRETRKAITVGRFPTAKEVINFLDVVYNGGFRCRTVNALIKTSGFKIDDLDYHRVLSNLVWKFEEIASVEKFDVKRKIGGDGDSLLGHFIVRESLHYPLKRVESKSPFKLTFNMDKVNIDEFGLFSTALREFPFMFADTTKIMVRKFKIYLQLGYNGVVDIVFRKKIVSVMWSQEIDERAFIEFSLEIGEERGDESMYLDLYFKDHDPGVFLFNFQIERILQINNQIEQKGEIIYNRVLDPLISQVYNYRTGEIEVREGETTFYFNQSDNEGYDEKKRFFNIPILSIAEILTDPPKEFKKNLDGLVVSHPIVFANDICFRWFRIRGFYPY